MSYAFILRVGNLLKLRASPKKENNLLLLPKFRKGDFQEAEDIVWINKAIAIRELQNMAGVEDLDGYLMSLNTFMENQ